MKRAFVIMPFQSPFDSYYFQIYKPALESIGFTVARVDDLYGSHSIMDDIQESIKVADLILCDMSARNPNVFYELGLAHAIGKPVVLVSNNINDIPFDLKHIRTIIYKTDEASWQENLYKKIVKFSTEKNPSIYPAPLVPLVERGQLLDGPDEIYSAGIECMRDATDVIRATAFGNPEMRVSEEYLIALAKFLQERKKARWEIEYRLIFGYDSPEISQNRKEQYAQRLAVFGEYGVIDLLKVRYTRISYGVDYLIIDDKRMIFAFPTVTSAQSLREGYYFKNIPKLISGFRTYFDDYLWNSADRQPPPGLI